MCCLHLHRGCINVADIQPISNSWINFSWSLNSSRISSCPLLSALRRAMPFTVLKSCLSQLSWVEAPVPCISLGIISWFSKVSSAIFWEREWEVGLWNLLFMLIILYILLSNLVKRLAMYRGLVWLPPEALFYCVLTPTFAGKKSDVTLTFDLLHGFTFSF